MRSAGAIFTCESSLYYILLYGVCTIGNILPALQNEIVSSLVLSMLQQMAAEERAEEVRAAVTRSLGILMGVIHDPDKYTQGCQLLFSSLVDSSEQVAKAVRAVFLPAFAVWAQELGRLESNFVQSLLDRLDGLIRVSALLTHIL